MRFIGVLFTTLILCGCGATQQAITQTTFPEPSLPEPSLLVGQGLPTQDQIFELPQPAKDLLNREFPRYRSDPVERVIDFEQWMAKPGGFRVLYDNETTYVAAETYAQGAGNCMSLAILTAAFARHLNLHVSFMSPDVPYFWEMREGLERINGHVNVAISAKRGSLRKVNQQAFLVDFSRAGPYRVKENRKISENEAISWFYRNRAAEALEAGELELAYSYAYQVKQMMPDLAGTYSLLGLILRRQGEVELAEQAYLYGDQLEQDNPFILNNLVYLYQSQGRPEQALAYQQRLSRLKIESPFGIARQADELYAQGDFKGALALYKKAIRKADYVHDFHFGKARSLFSLGEYKAANRALEKAKELSMTLSQGARYEQKLAAIKPYL